MKFLILIIGSALALNAFAKENLVLLEDWNASDKQKEYVMSLIKTAAEEVSDIWYDTILESDYELTSEKLEIYNIQVEISSGQAIAFHAYVSQPASYTGACDYNDDIDGYEESCLAEYSGSISEEFIVNWRGEVLESDGYAEFDN